MPRGVSQRKGAPAVKQQAPVPAVPQVTAALAPSDDAQAPPPFLPAVAPILADEPAPARPANIRNRRGSVDDMPTDDLKRYALSIGISQRNVDYLTPERLRQNCKAKIIEAMED